MEAIKQEIISCIYENGEQLITGPILQGVLLDMVDDVNDKVASASAAVPGDLVEKTGSWDDTADWVEQNSSSVVLQPDLDGYATEQWVEDQGYLKEIPEGYATTESLNDLSESVAQSIADIPEPDLSNYVTKPELNEATESVKDWVEAKHYLTTASLSGSVTEESVGFMINDATASVKSWVGDQNYATETFVSQAIAEIPGTDLTGYATEQWVEEQGYLKEHQDISGLATTESVTSLSESVAQDFANLNIPDVSGLATTESVNQLSESIAQTIEDLPQVDLDGYVTTASYNADSASFDQRINNIPVIDPSEYVTTGSFGDLEGRVDTLEEDVANLANARDALEGAEIITWDDENEEWTAVPLATSESVGLLSQSVSQSIVDSTDMVANKAEASLTSLSESFAETIANIPQADLSGYLQTSSYLVDSASFDSRIKDAREEATTAITNVSEGVVALSASFDSRINDITGSDLSGYATTESVNQLSSSVSSDIQNARTEASQAISGLGTIVEGMSDQISGLSASFDERINSITGSSSPVDLSGYATTSSVNQLSESLDSTDQYIQQEIQGLQEYMDSANPEGIYQNLDGLMDYVREGSSEDPYEWNGTWKSNLPKYATTESVNTLSASFDQRINNITGSGGSGVDTDLRNYLFGTASLIGNNYLYPSASSNWVWEISQSETFNLGEEIGEGKSIVVLVHNVGSGDALVSFDSTYQSDLNSVVNGLQGSGSFKVASGEYGDIVATQIDDKIYFRTSINVGDIDIDLSEYVTTASYLEDSASFSLRIDSIDIPDVSVYATTASVITLSQSLSESIHDVSGLSPLYIWESQSILHLDGSDVTSISCSISGNVTASFDALPEDGKAISVTIFNSSNSTVEVRVPTTYTVDDTTIINHLNGNAEGGTFVIGPQKYGDAVFSRMDGSFYIRTSLTLPEYHLFTGSYATEVWTFVLEDSSSVSKNVMISA